MRPLFIYLYIQQHPQTKIGCVWSEYIGSRCVVCCGCVRSEYNGADVLCSVAVFGRSIREPMCCVCDCVRSEYKGADVLCSVAVFGRSIREPMCCVLWLCSVGV